MEAADGDAKLLQELGFEQSNWGVFTRCDCPGNPFQKGSGMRLPSCSGFRERHISAVCKSAIFVPAWRPKPVAPPLRESPAARGPWRPNQIQQESQGTKAQIGQLAVVQQSIIFQVIEGGTGLPSLSQAVAPLYRPNGKRMSRTTIWRRVRAPPAQYIFFIKIVFFLIWYSYIFSLWYIYIFCFLNLYLSKKKNIFFKILILYSNIKKKYIRKKYIFIFSHYI